MNCNKCGSENSDDAKFCMNCGKSLVSKNEKVKKGSLQSEWNLLAIFGAIAIVFGIVFYFTKIEGGKPQKKKNNKEQSVAYQLATLDKGSYISEDDISIKRYSHLLNGLDIKYNQNKKEIGNMTYKAKMNLEEIGIDLNMLFLMEELSRQPRLRNGNYAEVMAVYITLRRSNFTHSEILENWEFLSSQY